jgi:hypothetical protein
MKDPTPLFPVTDPTKPRHHTTQRIEELTTVVVRLEDLCTRIATARDVIEGSLVLNAQRSSHGRNSLADS